MESTNDFPALCSAPQRDRHNQKRVILWSLAWAIAFLVVSFSIKREWLSAGWDVAAVLGTALFGIGTVVSYYRFLIETDELRRKIEVEALALVFGIGIVGGLTFWLLSELGIVSGKGFAFVFAAMILAHALGVIIGRRRYS
jgi:hypothetical protein